MAKGYLKPNYIVEYVPTWSIEYIVLGKSSKITKEQKSLVDKWIANNRYKYVIPTEDDWGRLFRVYYNNPPFGEAGYCVMVECYFN